MDRGTIIKYVMIIVSGICWSVIAILIGNHNVLPMSVAHVISCILTSYIVTQTLFKAIVNYDGWRWLALPLASIALGSFTYGFLATIILSFQGGVDGLFNIPLLLMFYSLTVFVLPLYFMALITHVIIHLMFRKI